MVDRFFKNFLHLVDTDAALFLHTNASLEWLQTRMDTLQNLILFVAASLFVFVPGGSLSPGNIKFSMIYYSTFMHSYGLMTGFLRSSHVLLFSSGVFRPCRSFSLLCPGFDKNPDVLYYMDL